MPNKDKTIAAAEESERSSGMAGQKHTWGRKSASAGGLGGAQQVSRCQAGRRRI